MSLHIGVLYHWSSPENRDRIRREGLQVSEPASDGSAFRAPWICLGTTPSTALELLPIDPYSVDLDLWQVRLSETDQLRIRGDFSPYVREIRVCNSIPAARVWWVGAR